MADIGRPFPIDLPKQTKSPLISKYFCAPPNENRNPVTISSRIRSEFEESAIFLTRSKKSFEGLVNTVGSRTIAAI